MAEKQKFTAIGRRKRSVAKVTLATLLFLLPTAEYLVSFAILSYL